MTKEVESDKNDKTHFLDIKAMQSDACHLLSPCHLLSYFVTVHVKRHLCEALSMCLLSTLSCQLCQLGKTALRRTLGLLGG